jgi:DNA-binding MarR family transcriptional regulator
MTQRFVHGYLGYLLGQANHAVYKNFDAQVRAAGLSSIEWRVLATLFDGQVLSVSALAMQILSKQPTVTKLVQRMAQCELIELRADPSDQRRTLVAITALGKQQVRPLIGKAKQHEAHILQALGATKTVALKTALEKLIKLQLA